MRKLIRFILAAALLALPVQAIAEMDGDKALSVTATTQTVTFASARSSFFVLNNANSVNEVYLRVFRCSETAAAVTVANSKYTLLPGETLKAGHNPRTEPGIGYCAFSIICDTAESATVRYGDK